MREGGPGGVIVFSGLSPPKGARARERSGQGFGVDDMKENNL